MSTTTPNKSIVPLALTVSEPDQDQIESVQSMQPGATQGNLCLCRGQATPPEMNLSSLGVRMMSKRPGETAPTIQELFSNCVPVFPDENYLWRNDTGVQCFCEEAPTANNNTLHIAASWMRMLKPMDPPVNEVKQISFKGKREMMCPMPPPMLPPTIKAAAAPATPATLGAVPTPKIDVEPWDMVGGFLEYRPLSVKQIAQGNRLMRNGAPLQASRIAISAFDVAWQYGATSTTCVSRAVGEGEVTPAPIGWFFAGLPKSCIVVWQGSLSQRRVLVSECREHPDVFTLDPTLPIYVQVNFAWENILFRSGAFGVHVRVLEL